MIPPNKLGPDISGKAVNETQYRGMIGSLMYLKGTSSLGLWYLKCSGFYLKGYSDSDYAGCNMDKKSTAAEAEYVFSTWMEFKGNTHDLGSSGEETDKITDLHQFHEEVLFTECRDGVAGIKLCRRDLSSDGVRDLATTSGCGQLNEDLESSTETNPSLCSSFKAMENVNPSSSTSNSEFLNPKKKIEIESWLEDSRIVDSLVSSDEIKYFDTFLTLEELEYHEWLLKCPKPP
ncbi:hypothetical protein Tco_0985182 [Tanacetum coccineum]